MENVHYPAVSSCNETTLNYSYKRADVFDLRNSAGGHVNDEPDRLSTKLQKAMQEEEVQPLPEPLPEPLPISPWLASALLQKALRRGVFEFAVRAASTLLAVEPARLWRRLAGIAVEDVGIGDLAAVELLAASLSNKTRRDLGGDRRVAGFILNRLSTARKCRSSDDLLLSADRHPSYAKHRLDLAYKPLNELLNTAVSHDDIIVRAIAVTFIVRGNRVAGQIAPQRRNTHALFEAFAASGVPVRTIEITRLCFSRTGELLPPLLCLLRPHLPACGASSDDLLPPEIVIRGVPGWALDMFSRDGRAAMSLFLGSDSESARWVRAEVPKAQRLDVFGHLLFRVEGGLCLNRLSWPLAEKLRRMVDLECHAPFLRNAGEFLSVLRNDIPILNDMRLKSWKS